MLAEANLEPLSSAGLGGKVTHLLTYDRYLTPEEAEAAIPAALRIPGAYALVASHITPLIHPVQALTPHGPWGQNFRRLPRDIQQTIFEREDQTLLI